MLLSVLICDRAFRSLAVRPRVSELVGVRKSRSGRVIKPKKHAEAPGANGEAQHDVAAADHQPPPKSPRSPFAPCTHLDYDFSPGTTAAVMFDYDDGIQPLSRVV